MNDCVFHALQACIRHALGVGLFGIQDYRTYLALKRYVCHPHDMFPACCVPFLTDILLGGYMLSYKIECEQPFGYDFWVAHATTRKEAHLARLASFYFHISDGPGVYLPLYNKHAYFSLTRPEEPVVMSIKIQKESQL